MGFRTRQGEQPIDPEHAEDDAGQARLVQVEADTEVPTETGVRPDLVTEDDGSGVAGGASGSSGGGSSMPGHPDASR
ncbi:preprotein translocase YidC [Micromonospora craterilacus]|uniref:Preprotein translocase YidC n=1 Tax=Micromonospora craterilacus TaxID=1655439 RepID=A0A2W2EBW8_9ACTN|nr:preprotein translocase YidC [Micromonospora craterilacus]PZG19961.1 preprotein translocase YidC [Micromonospora craterilacus]